MRYSLTVFLLLFVPVAAYSTVSSLDEHLAKGKWRCDMHESQVCTWGAGDLGGCKLSDRVDDVVDTTFSPHFIEWFELDLDADPKALYFCSRSGCATGSFAHRDPAVVTINIGPGIAGQEGMHLFFLSIATNWKIAFVIEVLDFPD